MLQPEIDEWVAFRVYAERSAAEALCGQLRADGCPAAFEARALSSALESSFTVRVPRILLHRANWIVSQLPISDAELEFLATGKRPGDSGGNN